MMHACLLDDACIRKKIRNSSLCLKVCVYICSCVCVGVCPLGFFWPSEDGTVALDVGKNTNTLPDVLWKTFQHMVTMVHLSLRWRNTLYFLIQTSPMFSTERLKARLTSLVCLRKVNWLKAVSGFFTAALPYSVAKRGWMRQMLESEELEERLLRNHLGV